MENGKIATEYILITSQNFPSGGAGATYINLFCRGLKINRCPIRVLLLKGHAFGKYSYKGPRKNITEDGVPYTYLGFKQRPINKFLKILEELISLSRLIVFFFSQIRKRKSICIMVYNSDLLFNVPIFIFSRIFRIKVVKFIAEFVDKSEFGNSFFGKIKRYCHGLNFKYLNKISDKLIVFSYYLKNEYIKMGFNESKIIVQPNLTDFDYWKTINTEIKYTLGYSGAPYLKDGLYDLFKAISLLEREGVNVNLLVIGDATFGESLIPGLKLECEKLGITRNVVFSGLVESLKVKQYLAECKILAITRPSTVQTKSGFPTKLGEYFAIKKPVLATNFGDMEKYFSNDSEIIMAECENPESIAEKIRWMLNNNIELESICEKGYNKAKELLEYKNSVKRMINLLEFN